MTDNADKLQEMASKRRELVARMAAINLQMKDLRDERKELAEEIAALGRDIDLAALGAAGVEAAMGKALDGRGRQISEDMVAQMQALKLRFADAYLARDLHEIKRQVLAFCWVRAAGAWVELTDMAEVIPDVGKHVAQMVEATWLECDGKRIRLTAVAIGLCRRVAA